MIPLPNPQVTIVFIFVWFLIERSTDVLQKISQRPLLHENLKAFSSRFLALAYEPRHFAPLVVDYWLLLQSSWSRRQLGPDVVYPMLSIRKRQSGRLARLLLEHSRGDSHESLYELLATRTFPKGIDPPCVAVIDLDEVPRDVAENGYSTQVDRYGLTCMLMLFETIVTLIMHVFFLWEWGWMAWLNWVYGAILNIAFCAYAVLRGDGALMLALRSDTSTPGCAVFLDQDFTVILNGTQSVVEAIAESSFNLSHPNSVWKFRLGGEGDDRDSSRDLLEALCEGAYLGMFSLSWLLFRPTLGGTAPIMVISIAIMAAILQKSPVHHTELEAMWFWGKGVLYRAFPIIVILAYEQVRTEGYYWTFGRYRSPHALSIVLIILSSAGYRARSYPIRSEKFLDALGNPPVRKWQFDTPVAAATFQCLVLCRGIARPIRSIDVPALLDMLVPDQRDVWKAWKERVADRIVHEADILYAPTIPTFGDERQQQLKDLLDQAQLGDDAYRHFYVCPHVRRKPAADTPLPIYTVV